MPLGKTLLIANPTSQSGKGLQAALHVTPGYTAVLGEENFDVEYTQAACHATEIAAKMDPSYQTIIALGGDGLIHEVATGLMQRPKEKRPTLAVIPVGSGNDYAKSLGMSNKLDKAVQQTLLCNAQPADVGTVNEHFFVETLSFGIDAAIALDTVERRKNSNKIGAALYFEAGVDQLLHHLDDYAYTAIPVGSRAVMGKPLVLKEGLQVKGESITFAVQVGRTYGGGFDICPEAKLDDGYLDICIAHPPISAARALTVFARALKGKHTGINQIEMAQLQGMTLDFEKEPMIQIDGEKLTGTHFEIGIQEHALQVIRGTDK